MKYFTRCTVLLAFVALACGETPHAPQTADTSSERARLAGSLSTAALPNTETLDDINIPIPMGTGVVIAGVGLVGDPDVAQPGVININVPGEPVLALLYWTGHNKTNATDNTVLLNGVTPIVGTLLGGPTLFFNEAWSSTQRADITGMIGSGPNAISIEGLEFTTLCPSECQNLGAGILVVYNDMVSTPAEIGIKDGNDNAFIGFSSPLDTTVPQTFFFAPSTEPRMASLSLFAGSVAQFPTTGGRPNVVEVSSGGTTTRYVDKFQGNSGNDFDAVTIPDVLIPANAVALTVQALSEKDATSSLTGIPASFNWLCASLVVQPEEEEQPLGCRVTGGQVDESGNCRFCPEGSSGENRFTCGGQAGANTAVGPPSPSGNWTHSNKNGPAGKFTFHGGTPSAPPGTLIEWIECSDPDNCDPARDAPAKQIDFGGIGTFKNMQPNVPDVIKSKVEIGVSLHRFEVNIDDGGEPGKSGKQDPPTGVCPPDGFGRNSDTEFGVCECPDFYRIVIYADETTDTIIYEAAGYIGGGNFQIHPPTGFDTN